MERDDGGPAFPVASGNGAFTREGMTLRDYFAAAALQGLCSNPGGPYQANDNTAWGIVNATYDEIAAEAYSLADAMLAARRKEPGA